MAILSAADWIRAMYQEAPGLVHVCASGDWSGRCEPTDPTGLARAASHAESWDRDGRAGVYVRATTISRPLARGERGGITESAALVGLWLDVDIAGPGHKHTPNRPDLPGYNPGKIVKHPLPESRELALSLLTESGFPEPTLVVDSGGGLYPWWVLDHPEPLDDKFALDSAAFISERLHTAMIRNFALAGYHLDNTGDLARVLRVPGTVNRKHDQHQPCHIATSGGPRYPFDRLSELVAELDQRTPHPQFDPPKISQLPAPSQPRIPGASPFDVLAATVDWDDILTPHGWRPAGGRGKERHWTRPGKNNGVSATTGHSDDGVDRMWNFSSSADLPVGEPMTKGHVYALLYHAGDHRAAARELAARGIGQVSTPTSAGATTKLPPPATPPVAPPAVQPATAPAQPEPGQLDQWPVPDHPAIRSPLPAFPTESLPGAMRQIVEETAAALQVDPSLPAMMALATVSAFAAPRFAVRAKLGWEEALSLYTCAVAESGERKSPVCRVITQPLRGIQRRMAVEHDQSINELVDQLDAQRSSPELRGSPAKANRLEDQIAALEASRKRPPRVALPKDATPEALARDLAAQGGAGAVIDDEGTFFRMVSGRDSGSPPNTELLLAAYDGDPYQVSRIGRAGEDLDRPVMALGLSTQPRVVADTLHARRGVLIERGFPARVLWAVPRSRVGTRNVDSDESVSEHTQRAWALTLEGLADLPTPDSGDEVSVIVLSPATRAVFRDFQARTELEYLPGGRFASFGMREWGAKHPGRCLRIAAILHLAAGYTNTTEIGEGTMRAAVVIADWAVGHAARVHTRDAETEDEATVEQCVHVLRWIRRRYGDRPVPELTRRDVMRGVRGGWVNAKSIQDAIDQLVESGWLRARGGLDKGGRPRVVYEVSPRLALVDQVPL